MWQYGNRAKVFCHVKGALFVHCINHSEPLSTSKCIFCDYFWTNDLGYRFTQGFTQNLNLRTNLKLE